MYKYLLPLGPPSHFLPSHSSKSSQSTKLSSLCSTAASHKLCILHMGCIYVNATLSVYPILSFPLCVYKSVLYLCLYSCPANRFISTIFLDSIYTLIYNSCFSDILHTVWQTLDSSTSLQMTQFYTFFHFCPYFIHISFLYDTGTSSNRRPEACELLFFIY